MLYLFYAYYYSFFFIKGSICIYLTKLSNEYKTNNQSNKHDYQILEDLRKKLVIYLLNNYKVKKKIVCKNDKIFVTFINEEDSLAILDEGKIV